jgi:hypothetical protein
LPSVGLFTATKLRGEGNQQDVKPDDDTAGLQHGVEEWGLLVEPAVAGRVHLVELGKHGPHGFVGEVVHQLLRACRKKHDEEMVVIHRVYMHTDRNQRPNMFWW